MTIHSEIRWHKRVCDDRLNGWLQCPAEDTICRYPPACGHHTGIFCGGTLPPCGATGERSEFNIKPPFGAPLLIFPRVYLLKTFPQVDTSARQLGCEIIVFPLLGELPKAIEPHLPVCQLYRWQLGPNMWSSLTTKSFDPIVVNSLRVGFPGESHGPATCGFACNCPKPEAWTTEASGCTHYVALILSCAIKYTLRYTPKYMLHCTLRYALRYTLKCTLRYTVRYTL